MGLFSFIGDQVSSGFKQVTGQREGILGSAIDTFVPGGSAARDVAGGLIGTDAQRRSSRRQHSLREQSQRNLVRNPSPTGYGTTSFVPDWSGDFRIGDDGRFEGNLDTPHGDVSVGSGGDDGGDLASWLATGQGLAVALPGVLLGGYLIAKALD